jgi:predicted RecA/RadA family phage recombinase
MIISNSHLHIFKPMKIPNRIHFSYWVLLGEVKAVAEREVPQGEAGGVQQQVGTEPEVPLGEQRVK